MNLEHRGFDYDGWEFMLSISNCESGTINVDRTRRHQCISIAMDKDAKVSNRLRALANLAEMIEEEPQ